MKRTALIIVAACAIGSAAAAGVWNPNPFEWGTTTSVLRMWAQVNTNFQLVASATNIGVASTAYATNAGWASVAARATNANWANVSATASNAQAATWAATAANASNATDLSTVSNQFVLKSGDTMTGSLILPAANMFKTAAGNTIGMYAEYPGHSEFYLTNWSSGGYVPISVGTPADKENAATKGYADAVVTGAVASAKFITGAIVSNNFVLRKVFNNAAAGVGVTNLIEAESGGSGAQLAVIKLYPHASGVTSNAYIDASSVNIKNVAAPVDNNDAVTKSYVDAAAYIYFLSNGIPVRDIDVTCNPINIEQNASPTLPSVDIYVKSTKYPYNINIVDFQVFYNSAHGYMYISYNAPIYDGQSGYRWNAIMDTLTTKYGVDYSSQYYSYGYVLALDGSTPYQLNCFNQFLSPSTYSVGNSQVWTCTYAVKQDDKVELSRIIYHFNIIPGM
ncbi:MAG: hypothetical protein NTV22_11285 [bacterium]|nr:hypothetical protein [bacterium]